MIRIAEIRTPELIYTSKGKCLLGNCENDCGRVEYDNGSIYTGYFKDGLPNGIGQIMTDENILIKSNFISGSANGATTAIYPNGNQAYFGTFINGKIHGVGTFFHPEGHIIYQGEIKYGILEGIGYLNSKSEEKSYIGIFKENNPHGIGVIECDSNLLFSTKFKVGNIDGRAIVVPKLSKKAQVVFYENGKVTNSFNCPKPLNLKHILDRYNNLFFCFKNYNLIDGLKHYETIKYFAIHEIVSFIKSNNLDCRVTSEATKNRDTEIPKNDEIEYFVKSNKLDYSTTSEATKKRDTEIPKNKYTEDDSTDSIENKYSPSTAKFNLQYRTADGHFVRSRGELMIADWLYHNKIRYEYEKILPVKQYVLCDFYLPDHNQYVEYWGLDNPEYLKRKEQKLSIYRKNHLKLLEINNDDICNIDKAMQTKLYQHK